MVVVIFVFIVIWGGVFMIKNKFREIIFENLVWCINVKINILEDVLKEMFRDYEVKYFKKILVLSVIKEDIVDIWMLL